MANNIVQLTDDTNNNIFPIAGGMASDSIITAMLQDEAVTAGKLAQYAVNEGIVTNNNLAPASDTPSGWNTLLGGGKQGVYKTRYNTANIFTNQPSQYGELFTIRSSTDMVQLWFRYNLPLKYRYGNNNGGWLALPDGSFEDIIDKNQLYTRLNATEIVANKDLNHLDYCQPGKYYCRLNATAGTLSNCPTAYAFSMETVNVTGLDPIIESGTLSTYLVRTITDIHGDMWVQHVNSGSSSPVTWNYYSWTPINNNITMQTTDPGEGATLAAGQFIAVYSA